MKYIYRFISVWFLCLYITSCTDLSSIEDNISNLSGRISTLEQVSAILQKAMDEGKLIVDIKPINEGVGYEITFDDNQQIEVINANSGALIISSIERDEENGFVTLVLNDGRTFYFGLDINYPTGIIVLSQYAEITSKGTCEIAFLVNPSNALANKDESVLKKKFSLRVADTSVGTEVLNNVKIDRVYAESDLEGTAKEGKFKIVLKDQGLEKSYIENIYLDFSVNDNSDKNQSIKSNVFSVELKRSFDHFSIGNVEGEVYDNFIHIRMPNGIDISKLTPTFSTNGKVLVNGIEQVSGVSMQNFNYPVTYEVTGNSGRPEYYTVFVSSTDMPVVYIVTDGLKSVTSKESYLENTSIRVFNDKNANFYSKVKIKGRGNSSWEQPKKPYTVKLDKKENFLGFRKHKTFAFVANYTDKSLLRNQISYQLGRDVLTNMSWNPSTRNVHLFLNGKYDGVYMATESVKINENRVNIPNIEDCKDLKDAGKYGFIIEVNAFYDENFNFTTPVGVKLSLKDPDGRDISQEIKNYIKKLVISCETALYSSDFANPFSNNYFYKFIDADSFIDWWIGNELAKNLDSNFCKSCYLYYDPSDKKLHMTPLWDFDAAYGNENILIEPKQTWGWWISKNLWFQRMFMDPIFLNKIKQRWISKYPEIQNWANQIKPNASVLEADANRNFTRWPGLGVGYQNRTTYQSEVDDLIKWVNARIKWMNAEIRSW